MLTLNRTLSSKSRRLSPDKRLSLFAIDIQWVICITNW